MDRIHLNFDHTLLATFLPQPAWFWATCMPLVRIAYYSLCMRFFVFKVSSKETFLDCRRTAAGRNMMFFLRHFEEREWVSSVDSFLLFSNVFKWLSHVETMSIKSKHCVNHTRKPSRCNQTKKTKQSYCVDSSSHSRSCSQIVLNTNVSTSIWLAMSASAKAAKSCCEILLQPVSLGRRRTVLWKSFIFFRILTLKYKK